MKCDNRSVLTDHRLEFNQYFDWHKVEILDSTPLLKKRLISEIKYIKKQKNNRYRIFILYLYGCNR